MTKEDKIVKQIAQRYGDSIDLKKTPQVMIEIIRQFGPSLTGGIQAACAPPGGPPKKLSEVSLAAQLVQHSADLSRTSKALAKMLRQRSASGARAR